MNRRSFLLGLAAGLAPAIIRTPGLLMPVRALLAPTPFELFQRGLIVAQEELEDSLFDFNTDGLICHCYERFGVAHSNWRNTWASPGL